MKVDLYAAMRHYAPVSSTFSSKKIDLSPAHSGLFFCSSSPTADYRLVSGVVSVRAIEVLDPALSHAARAGRHVRGDGSVGA
jgi:hypothetical protein